MSDCLFCKIVAGTIPSKTVYEDDAIVAFHDIHPQAPIHVVLVPRKHLASLNDAGPEDAQLLGRLLLAAQRVAAELGVGSGYRVVNNCGASAGQSVFHLHLHVLGGRALGWPPG
ncbi:MAG TPA: histidine triad nucleotide-binding protein [Candidatus Polarisedimenticolaceae bacterium]|nr:histidine triad nucleotide-binding protein [Candidatus Polarisedimenticolaceae bacterium]